MADFKVLKRVIQVVFDRTSGQKAAKEAEQATGRIGQGFNKLKGAAVALGAAIAAAFAVRKIVDFGQAAFRAATESERVWNRLAGTLRTVGVDFNDVEKQIRAAARAMQDTTTVGDEQFAETLQQLTIISGDFEKSLKNVEVAADLAAGAQIDMRTAAQLVGKAMVGETGTLKRYGIVVKDGADAVAEIRKQFGGLAANEAQTVAGRMRQLSNEFGDFLENIGGFIIRALEATRVIELMTRALRAANVFLERFVPSGTQRPTGPLGAGRDSAARDDRVFFRERAAALTREVQILTQSANVVGRLTSGDLERLVAIQNQLRAEQATTTSLERQLQIDKDLLAIAKARETLGLRARFAQAEAFAPGLRTTTPAVTRPSVGAPPRQIGTALARPEDITALDPLRLGITQHRAEQLAQFWEPYLKRGQEVAHILTGSFQTFFDTLIQGQGDIADAFVGLGKFMVSQLLEGFAQYLMVRAGEALGEGLLRGNPAALAAAVAFTTAAGLARALSSQLGAGGGGGRIGGGAADATRRNVDTRQREPSIEVNLYGDFDILSPRVQDTIAQAAALGQRRQGNTNVVVRTRRG